MAYFKYFIYLAWNWNVRLAWFVTWHEIRGERKYRQNTIGINDLKKEISAEALMHASVYQPVNYYTAEALFQQTYLEDVSGSLLDMGCGRGRIFGVGAHFGYKHIIGVDFSQKLCGEARATAERLAPLFSNLKIDVIYADAADYDIPETVTTLFLFNPFDDFVIQKMLNQLKASIFRKPRSIKILYANPVCRQSFLDNGFVETFYFKKLAYLEGSVLEHN